MMLMTLTGYQKLDMHGSDVLPLLDLPFSLVPMRATDLHEGKLDDGRKALLEYASRRTLECSRRCLVAGVRASRFFKGLLEPYEERALAVASAFEELTGRDGFDVRSIGYIPQASEKTESWPSLLMAVYNLNPNGVLDMRVIPTLGIENGSPIMPTIKLKEHGLIFTGRPENAKKWTDAGFSVEHVPIEIQ